MATQPTAITPATDPYAAYGGSVAVPTVQDPYAAYGGSVADTSAPAQTSQAAPASAPQDTGVLAGIKRNTVGPITGVYHALADPATDKEKLDLLQKVREQNARPQNAKNPIPETFATNPSRATLAYHRIIDAPADVLVKKGHDEITAAQDLLANHHYWRGGNMYLSGLADKALSAVPVVGPAINSIAERGESGDFSGAATDVAALVAAEHAPEIVGKVAGKLPTSISDIKPEWLTKRPDVPAPNHGTPVTVESPFDSAAISKVGGTGGVGGKDLSSEAVKTLQGHVGDKIPVGSTAKNMLVKAVEPVTKTIADTSSKMNDVVRNAPEFKTSVIDDGKVQNTFDQIKANLPASVRKSLGEDVDGVLKDNDDALNATDPVKVLEQRRLLGRQIDWAKIENNPNTPAEVQNLARAKVYRLLGDKIRAEIPDTAPLDKTLQPNIELRSHMKAKLGERLVDDPIAATVEHQNELQKGQTTIQNKLHNEKVARNIATVKTALGLAGAGAIGGEVIKRAQP